MSTSREVLVLNLHNLDNRAQGFAKSLLLARAPTAKQLYWIDRLADDAVKASMPKLFAKIWNVSAIIKLFDVGKSNLKYPKINIKVGEKILQLSLAGPSSQYPGSINIKDYYEKKWYGRIHIDGNWEPSKALDDNMSSSILEILIKFDKDPIRMARDYGIMTGHCCFCCKTLTDERSLVVGYGPICAKNYNLTWG